ncbi:MAG TPA: dihydrodipicolinate synthase family protein [Gemmatimonadaceae bacterium]|nr:dihydrodipicolinate synthase family protein [Gemmatimonadaceae bacterium]
MSKRLAGVLGPVVTTFDAETGDLAPVAFRANLRAHVAQGLAGVVLCGSTGEAPLLDDAERARLVEWARDVVPGDRWLIAGTGAESTRGTIARSRDAAERGADAVLVLPPHFFGAAMTAEALATHYRRVADASPVPVLLYNMPKYTHLTLDPGLVHELSGHGNVVGMKDSSGDLKQLGAYLGAQSDRFAVLTGNGGTLYAALEMGARGGILAVALFAGALAVEVYTARERGELARAGRAQERLQSLNKEIVAGLGVPGVKAAMDAMGLHGGAPRPPLLPLREQKRERVAELLARSGAASAV